MPSTTTLQAWYQTGKTLYDDERKPLHITSPYIFGNGGNFLATTATSPIANPTSNDYLGQVLLDFFPNSLVNIFNNVDEPFSFVITPEEGNNVVVAPGNFDGWDAAYVSDLLFPNDTKGSPNRILFEIDILSQMKEGKDGLAQFLRTNALNEVEKLNIAFEPVEARVLLPLDPSAFSRGSNYSTVVVYSVGIAFREDRIRGPWTAASDKIDADLERICTIYASVIGTVSILFILCTCYVSSFRTLSILLFHA
jgi:hypothetical protein